MLQSMRKWFLVSLILLVSSTVSRADFMLAFDQHSYQVNAGETVDLRVSLIQTTASGPVAGWQLFSVGLVVES
jgi:hypothetical protein